MMSHALPSIFRQYFISYHILVIFFYALFFNYYIYV